MRSIQNVLIPSDNRDFVVNFAEAYHRLGYDVQVGAFNFELETSQPDLVHFLWPEEFTNWKVPNSAQVDAVTARLDRLARRSRLVISVNNLYPHRHDKNRHYHRLYEAFYQRAEVIHHFSQKSKQMVCKEYPTIANRNHVVQLGFNYDRLLPKTPRNRVTTRAALGFAPDEMVYLCFGSLRSWEEVLLIKNAFARANVPRKRLLMAARYNEPGPVWQQRWRRWSWHAWQKRNRVVRFSEYIHDDEVYKLFDAADAVVVVRQHSMSSGIPCLAMTFGRFVIAPNVGTIPEFLAGADNVLYETDSFASLINAIERGVIVDREDIGAKNRTISIGWSWESIIQTCLKALPATVRAMLT